MDGRALAVLMAVILTLGLAGCQTPAASNGGDQAGTGQEGYPVTVTTKSATTTVESKPERVVTLSNAAFENVAALGVEPVGAHVTRTEDLPYFETYRGLPALQQQLTDESGKETDYEAIAALAPDLIVAPDWPVYRDPATLKRLQELAPTLIFDTLSPGTDWRTGVVQTGQALGQEAKARELVAAAEKQYASSTREDLRDRTFSFGLVVDGQIRLGSGGYMLKLTGLQPAADQKAVEETRKPISYSTESLGDVQGEIVFLMTRSEAEKENLLKAPAWRDDLDKRVVWLDLAQGEAVNNAGILGKTWFAEQLPTVLQDLR
ncbi:MAG: ABC transporter substrate-binding protein [Propionibacteriales bacterium]|nr:ABC transporter substrate-binding protein [Propionibacteriales bacterium]